MRDRADRRREKVYVIPAPRSRARIEVADGVFVDVPGERAATRWQRFWMRHLLGWRWIDLPKGDA